MNTHADKTKENKSRSFSNEVSQKQKGHEPSFQFVDNRPEAVVQRKLQEMADNSRQERHQSIGGVLQRVPGLVKAAAKKLTFDDLIWGGHADHYATEAKYVDKGREIVEKGKPTHTTFMIDRYGVTEDLITQNIKKNGWMDNPPAGGDDFIVSPAMNYVRHDQTPGGIQATYGHGYPEVRVRADQVDLKEATGDSNGDGSPFYSPYHLQNVEEA